MVRPKDRISIVGLGFVGLSLAVANARNGFNTIGVDTDGAKIDRLKVGQPDFFEPGIDAMLMESIRQKKLHFTTDFGYAIRNTNITFLAVGTPLESGADKVNLSHVKSAVERISLLVRSKNDFHLLAIKSTVPPLTTENLILPAFNDLIKDGRVDVVMNPEFMSEGTAIANLLKPPSVVIGANSKRGSLALEKYYKDFYKTPTEIIRTNIATAELIKYASNAFLATKISFINSIASLCQEIPGSDVNAVAHAIGKDPRIGPLFLRAGPGFGGSCLPKDLMGLIEFSEEIGKRSDLFKAVKEINNEQLKTMIEMIREQRILSKGNTIAILGLAFKSGTDDVRGAMSVRVVEKLLECELEIKVHDPMALKNFKQIFGSRISYSTSVGECINGSDCCIILAEWDMYKDLKPSDFKRMRSANIIDARRILRAEEFQCMNFRAIGLGR